MDLQELVSSAVVNVWGWVPSLMNDTVHLENLLNLPSIVERLIDENWSLYVLNQVLCHQTVMRVFLVVGNTLAIWKRYDLIS